MYKIMIVDDEKFVRKSIRNRMNWEVYHLQVSAEAKNGEEALCLMWEDKPDIVLTDIRMPKMDGLEFIGEAQKNFEDVSYIIMSAYSDFDYAKKALSLGVKNYILKPVKLDELGGTLEELVNKKIEYTLKRDISNGYLSEGYNLSQRYVVGIAFYIKENEMKQKTAEVIKQNFSARKNKIRVYYLGDFYSGNCMVFLLNGDFVSYEMLREMVEDIWECVSDLILSVAFSDIWESKNAVQAARQSVHLLKYRIFYNEEKIFCSKYEQKYSKKRRIVLQESIRKVYLHVINGEYSMAAREMLSMMNNYITSKNPVELIEELVDGMVSALETVLEDKEDQTDFDILVHRLKRRDYLLSYDSAEELRDDIKILIEHFLGVKQQIKERDIITKIKEFVWKNFSQELNVEGIARRFYLNASYLSTIFKETTGVNLKAYIEGVRMEKAKQYLCVKEWSVTLVALEVGYKDSGYFSKVFRQYTGMTPKQFREEKFN